MVKKGSRGVLRVNAGILSACTLAASLSCHAFERYECWETWYPYSIDNPQHLKGSRVRACPPEPANRVAFGWFHVAEGKVWWSFTETSRSRPCAGQGPGAMGNLLNPVCYLPDFLQIHHNVEYRSFWLVTEDSANFRMAPTMHTPLQDWQKAQLQRYAVDSTSAYLNSEKIPGANPATFEVLFPFGDEEKWNEYFVARDDKHIFFDQWALPGVKIENLAWLDLRCLPGDKFCDNRQPTVPFLGVVGSDLLLLGRSMRPTVFHNAAAPDLKCFRGGFHHFCRINGEFFQFRSDFDEEARLEPVNDSELALVQPAMQD